MVLVLVGDGGVALMLFLALTFFLIQLPGRGGPFDLDDAGNVFCFSNIFILSLMLLIVGTTGTAQQGSSKLVWYRVSRSQY